MTLKSEFPVHVIPGISDYTKTKTKVQPRVGLPGDSIAELTLQLRYEKLCSLGCSASSKPAKYAAFLNDCLEKVLLFKIQCGIVRSGFKAILLYVDTRKALL